MKISFFGIKEEEIDRFVSDIQAMTKENMNSPPEKDGFGKMTKEELSSVLTQRFNTLMSDKENIKVTKEEERSFFDGVLKLHPFRNTSREELTTSRYSYDIMYKSGKYDVLFKLKIKTAKFL